jgi:tRNA pseudouridine13 synthase
MIWKEEQRDVLVKPFDVRDVQVGPDERNAGRLCATLEFSLPRGAYATMMIKRLFAPSWYSQPDVGRQDDGPRRPMRTREEPRDGGLGDGEERA